MGSGITLELFNDFATIVTLYPKDLVRKASVRIDSGEGESPPEFQIDLRLLYIWMKGDTLRLDAEIPEKLRGKAHVPPGETREVQVRFVQQSGFRIFSRMLSTNPGLG